MAVKPRRTMFFFILLAALLIGGILVLFEHQVYVNGNQSLLFGTRNTYTKNQTLHFNNLDLKISSVIVKSYPKPTPAKSADCQSLFIKGAWNGFPYGGSAYSICESNIQYANKVESHYQSKDNLTISFTYNNVSDRPLNLKDYTVKIVANTSLADDPDIIYDGLRPNCSGLPSTEILKGNHQTTCLTMDIDKGYHGPLTLSVTSHGQEKDINLFL
jgi:hypothetical protein